MPGFDITNQTIWPLEISLEQVGPLYWGVVQPGQTFRRSTGAVWFTIKARVSLDGKEHITTWDAIWPIGAMVGTIALGALTGGYGAFVGAGSFLATAGTIQIGLAQLFVAGGLPAMSAIVASGATIGALSSSAAQQTLAAIFTKDNAAVSKKGCYAGISGHKKWTISGGPTLKPIPGTTPPQLELVPGKLYLH